MGRAALRHAVPLPPGWDGPLPGGPGPHLGPDGLERGRAGDDSPAVGEGLHKQQAAAGLGVVGGALRARQPVTARVGDLDAEGVTDDVEQQPEVPAGDAAMGDGVGRQLPDDELRRMRRQPPRAQLLGGEQPGETGAASLAAGLNPFAYVSNPLTWSDPLGLTPCEDAAKLAAARNETVLGPNVPTRAEASVGSTTSHNYKKTFFDAHPHLKGKVVVHHAIEQQVLKKYPGLFSADELHSLENLRGIPKGDINSKIHLSQIRVEWNRFYDANPNPTRREVLDQVTKVDDMLGNWFSPRIR